MNIGKNIKDIPINKIYIGMKVIERESFGDYFHEVIFVQERPDTYHQLVLRGAGSCKNHIKVICHCGNLKDNFYFIESYE